MIIWIVLALITAAKPVMLHGQEPTQSVCPVDHTDGPLYEDGIPRYGFVATRAGCRWRVRLGPSGRGLSKTAVSHGGCTEIAEEGKRSREGTDVGRVNL
jgi:hypothetical protein